MNKSWMAKDRFSEEYRLEVESFMQFALQSTTNHETMTYPCTSCGNLRRKKVNLVIMHLIQYGMDLTYYTWIWHGERYIYGNSASRSDQPRENLSKDPVDMVQVAYDESNDPSDFIKLLEDGEKPLYPGCERYTKLSAIMKLYNLKAKHSWSDSSFTELLTMLKDMLPPSNELPLSTYSAKKCLVSLGMDYEKINACPNDCILYRKEYENHTSCPTCGVSRWNHFFQILTAS